MIDARLKKDLKEKYQMYCRYETGIMQKYNKTHKESIIMRKFLRDKLNQFIISEGED